MIRRSVTLPAGPERVWEAITDPERMNLWFGGEMSWVLEPGAPLRFRGEDGEERRGRIAEIRPQRRLSFVWWRDREPPDREASEVTYLLEPDANGTRLTVQETPLEVTAPPARTQAGWHDWDNRLAGAWMDLSSTSLSGAGV